jgi:hypothetical protein
MTMESDETMLSKLRTARKHLVLAAALLAAPLFLTIGNPGALAQTPALPDAVKAEISDRCLAATKAIFRKPRIVVDPAGSQRFGLAILFGKSQASDERASLICVYDKQTKTVELGGEIGKDLLRVRVPKKDGQGDTPDDSEE